MHVQKGSALMHGTYVQTFSKFQVSKLQVIVCCCVQLCEELHHEPGGRTRFTQRAVSELIACTESISRLTPSCKPSINCACCVHLHVNIPFQLSTRSLAAMHDHVVVACAIHMQQSKLELSRRLSDTPSFIRARIHSGHLNYVAPPTNITHVCRCD
jgi:hypothetical protein